MHFDVIKFYICMKTLEGIYISSLSPPFSHKQFGQNMKNMASLALIKLGPDHDLLEIKFMESES